MFDISISFVYRLLNYTNSRGIDSETLLSNAGVDLADINRYGNKISASYYFDILNEALRLTNDPYFGLHMGEFFEWRNLSNLCYIMNLGYIMSSCRNLGEAVEKASNYLSFIGGPFDSMLVSASNLTEIVFQPKHTGHPHFHHVIDEALSSFVKIVKSITSKIVRIKEVRISHEIPGESIEYIRIFSCPVLFNQPSTALVFNSRDLAVPIVAENTKLFPISGNSERNPYKSIDGMKDYSKKVSILLFEQLKKGAPCIKQIAKELGMSVRCLQMKLNKEGETFSQIVRNVRKDLAKTYLVDRDYTIDEITYLLGFSDPSVFHRAFKNWTGVTPGEFRNVS
jgi:AraC-like DNA-binding protein